MSENDKDRGWYQKYIITVTKADGSLVDEQADYFVLRLDKDPAARTAALAYARACFNTAPQLAVDLVRKVRTYAAQNADTPAPASQPPVQWWDEQGNVWEMVDEIDDLAVLTLRLVEPANHYAELRLEAEDGDAWWVWMTNDTNDVVSGSERLFVDARRELLRAATGWEADEE
jgi:hypothetical protein